MARYPSGKGEVCKTFMRRFDPDPRLQFVNDLAEYPPRAKSRCREKRRDSLRHGNPELPDLLRSVVLLDLLHRCLLVGLRRVRVPHHHLDT